MAFGCISQLYSKCYPISTSERRNAIGPGNPIEWIRIADKPISSGRPCWEGKEWRMQMLPGTVVHDLTTILRSRAMFTRRFIARASQYIPRLYTTFRIFQQFMHGLIVIKTLLFCLDQIISSDVILCILCMHDFPVCLFNPAFRGCPNPINGLLLVVNLRMLSRPHV